MTRLFGNSLSANDCLPLGYATSGKFHSQETAACSKFYSFRVFLESMEIHSISRKNCIRIKRKNLSIRAWQLTEEHAKADTLSHPQQENQQLSKDTSLELILEATTRYGAANDLRNQFSLTTDLIKHKTTCGDLRSWYLNTFPLSTSWE